MQYIGEECHLEKHTEQFFCFTTSDTSSDLFFFRDTKKGHSKSLYFVLMISMFFLEDRGGSFVEDSFQSFQVYLL